MSSELVGSDYSTLSIVMGLVELDEWQGNSFYIIAIKAERKKNSFSVG